MKGYILLHRAINDCSFFDKKEKFCERMAWVDLIMLANYDESEIIIRHIPVKLNRGQLGWSEVSLARRWNWSRTKVRKFLDDLEKADMITQMVVPSTSPKKEQQNPLESGQQKEQQNDTAKFSPLTTVITITNYDEFQSKNTAKRTAKRTAKTGETEPQRIKDLSEKEISAHKFAEFWSAYKIKASHKGSKVTAKKSWEKLADEEKEKAVRSLSVFLSEWSDNNGGRFAPMVSTFLNQKRWESLDDLPLFESKVIVCPDCGGRGCDKCHGKGKVRTNAVSA